MEAELIIEILILIAAIYLAFFKSYLTEKGKSAALKEDIEVLTREVESVKNEFVKEQEMLKTDLQRILDNEISYRKEERDALINYHGIINEWAYSILEVTVSNYNKNNIDSLIQVRNRNSSYYAKAGIAKSKITLLVEDKTLTQAASDLFIVILQFHHWCDMEFLKLQHNSEAQKSLTDRFMIIIENYEGNKEVAEKMAIEEKQLKDEAKKLIDDYVGTNRIIEYGKIINPETNFEILVKEYLKN